MPEKATIVILQGYLDTAEWPEMSALWERLRASREVLAQWSGEEQSPRVRPIEHWLCKQLAWPPSPLEGLQVWPRSLGPGRADAYRVLLSPCHFDVRLDHVGVRGLGDAPLDEDEAHALCACLHDSLDAWSQWLGGALHIRCLSAMHWVAEVPACADLEGCSLALAEGLSVERYLPRGEHARIWRRMLNEIQMLWHEHPVNLRRAQARRPAVNALWFGGRLEPPGPRESPAAQESAASANAQVQRLASRRLHVRSQDPMLKGLEAYLEAQRDQGARAAPNAPVRSAFAEASCELVVMELEDSARHVQAVERALNQALRIAEICARAGEDCELVVLSDTAWIHWVKRQPRGLSAQLADLGLRLLGRR